LLKVGHLMGDIGEPHAVEADVAMQRVGRDGGGFDPPFRMFAGKAANQRHARSERLTANP
jgi:hypothetical protein